MGLFNFRANKIPLTDREGKTIYVKPEDKDKYVLTKNYGWLLKDKVYTHTGKKVVPMKGPVRYVSKRTGWQIHLDELESEKRDAKYWEEFGRPFLKEHDPEWLESFEKENGQFWYRDKDRKENHVL